MPGARPVPPFANENDTRLSACLIRVPKCLADTSVPDVVHLNLNGVFGGKAIDTAPAAVQLPLCEHTCAETVLSIFLGKRISRQVEEGENTQRHQGLVSFEH